MTTEQYRKWLQTQLLEVAVKKYPGNPRLQMVYQIAFLEQQLAHAMRSDSRTADLFISCIERAEDATKELK